MRTPDTPLSPEEQTKVAKIVALLNELSPTYMLVIPVRKRILEAGGEEPEARIVIVSAPGMSVADGARLLHVAAIKAGALASAQDQGHSAGVPEEN